MTLAETQELFYRLVTRGPDVDPSAVAGCFLGSPDLDAAERVGIYADMYLWRLVDGLREDFPKLAALLGDRAFFALCRDYVAADPSDDPDLGRLGRRLAPFLRARPNLARPDLPALAALEWARAEVFFAAPAAPVTSTAFSAVGDDLPAARLSLIPALRVLRLDHDVVTLWRQLEQGQLPHAPTPGQQGVVVWRTGYDVYHTVVDADEASALASAAADRPLAEVCLSFARRPDPAASAFAALGSWAAEGWIASVRSPEGCPCPLLGAGARIASS